MSESNIMISDKFLKLSIQLTIIFTFFAGIESIYAQSPNKKNPVRSKAVCETSKAQLPVLRGFYLGQSISDIDLPRFDEIYKEAKLKRDKPYDPVLVSLYNFDESERSNLPEFDDASFMVHFFEDRIQAIFIEYKEFEVGSAKEFIDKAAYKLGLPVEGWRYRDRFGASLKCKDFTADLWTGRYENRPIYQSFPTVSFKDDAAEKKQQLQKSQYEKLSRERALQKQQEEIRKKREEKARRQVFNP